MPYAIYPAIGFARLGNSSEFFIGRESNGSLGVEIQADGSEVEVERFKDANYRLKKQASRFRIFDVSDPAAPVEATLPAGSIIRWSVTLANRKDAVRRPGSPPPGPVAVVDDPARSDRAIHATATVEGSSAANALVGKYRGHDVVLGELRTDMAQRLMVLGGSGRAASYSNPPAPIGGDFYNNPDWFDDVGDGPVTATIEVPGSEPEEAAGAWVVVGPPDFAPPAGGVVTLYDVIREIAIEQGWLEQIQKPYFDSDIRPMIERASSLQHVDESSTWPMISQDWAALSDPSAASAQLRAATRIFVSEVENALHDFELRQWQLDALNAWEAGEFHPGTAPNRGACDELTRAALDGTVGQGFFPGIEAGVNVMDPARYQPDSFEYRLSHAHNKPGDLTALMALPWQADFLKCGQSWWPAQRPYRIAGEDGIRRPWMRPWMDHRALVDNVSKLGVLTPGGGAFAEVGRDPSLGSDDLVG